MQTLFGEAPELARLDPRQSQWLTPEWAAQAIVDEFWPDLTPDELVLEPSCGRGAFLKAVPAHVPAVGVELDPALAAFAAVNTGRTVLCGDFRTLHLGAEHDPRAIQTHDSSRWGGPEHPDRPGGTSPEQRSGRAAGGRCRQERLLAVHVGGEPGSSGPRDLLPAGVHPAMPHPPAPAEAARAQASSLRPTVIVGNPPYSVLRGTRQAARPVRRDRALPPERQPVVAGEGPAGVATGVPPARRRRVGTTGGGMNYPANRTVWQPGDRTVWQPGDLVVHDCDAKKPRMLIRVVARLPDGQCQTEYVDAELRSRWGEGTKSRLLNPPAYLHDPALWGIPLDAGEDDPAYDRDCPRRPA